MFSLRQKLYISVLLIFLIFAVTFIVFQQMSERGYRVSALAQVLFAIIICAVLTLVLSRFINRMDANITKLRTFANRIDHNEAPNITDLADFPNDELGDIAKRLVKIYNRLQDTGEEQNRLKRELTQNIEHELKTPVASIQGYLETIIDNPDINEETKRKFIVRCYAQTERLASLLNDISTLNHMDDTPNVIEFENIYIYIMVSEIQKETALQLKKRGMSFHNLISDNVVVKGNRSSLYSVFRNLTDNAIAYAGDGTTIKLTAYDDKYYWHFSFSDNGCGVSPEHLDRLFERFYRVDTGRSRKIGGTGLGLAIVKNVILQHGGSIFASNNPDGGLRFDFSLRK